MFRLKRQLYEVQTCSEFEVFEIADKNLFSHQAFNCLVLEILATKKEIL
jgi:hypothetical protein